MKCFGIKEFDFVSNLKGLNFDEHIESIDALLDYCDIRAPKVVPHDSKEGGHVLVQKLSPHGKAMENVLQAH